MLLIIIAAISFAFRNSSGSTERYTELYSRSLQEFRGVQDSVLQIVEQANLQLPSDVQRLRASIATARMKLKGMDFWFRYLDPLAYKRINAPLPVEWETEVFEKYEKPYKREGAGLSLALMYLDEETLSKEKLKALLQASVEASSSFAADSITKHLQGHHHFFLCNRLFLLNLAAIYTTGFECPDTAAIIPELRSMLGAVRLIYQSYNRSFEKTPLPDDYLQLFEALCVFVAKQPDEYSSFNHFLFLRDFVNPLFARNQACIQQYKVRSKSMVDYSLNREARSVFDKDLYYAQNTKGIFLRVNDSNVLSEIDRVGKLLFYDPLLSGNNERSCASCHKPTEYFTDTSRATALQFNKEDAVERNTPTLINAPYNHLIMADGSHISLQGQAAGVMQNPVEMSAVPDEVLKNILSCEEYKRAFSKLLEYTPQEKEISIEHIISAITTYYGKFSSYYSPFDLAMREKHSISAAAQRGFNLFMSKAQCATCHFVPQFNGIKPPYVSSEFEVLGVPADTAFSKLSPDRGRYTINPAEETLNAFRTGTVRNSAFTKPYMHNGVFRSLEQVIDFYNNGGGVGRKLSLENQTLSSERLNLSAQEKQDLIAFIHSLNEEVVFEEPPATLPLSSNKTLNSRKVGGSY